MKGAMIYVNAGKGHYIPAKALADSFEEAGHEAMLVELFSIFNAPLWESFVRNEWRFMLKHPKLEAKADASSDSPKTANTIRRLAFHKKHVRAFARWYEENRPDFLLSTNFLGGALLPYAVKALGLNIPVYQYCPDVFDSPGSGVCNLLTKAYIASDFGKDVLISKGQSPDTVSVCPFPLRKQFMLAGSLSKEEARKRLELPDRFTILCSFGGEGIGSIALLYELASRNVPCQAVVIGGHSKSTDRSFYRFSEKYPDFPLYQRGFVDNVEEYLVACDIQVGKGGINSILEAISLRRPFIITEILYLFRNFEKCFRDNKVGWAEEDPHKQADIIESYFNDGNLRKKVDDAFDTLPIDISADRFRDLIIKDTEEYYSKIR